MMQVTEHQVYTQASYVDPFDALDSPSSPHDQQVKSTQNPTSTEKQTSDKPFPTLALYANLEATQPDSFIKPGEVSRILRTSTRTDNVGSIDELTGEEGQNFYSRRLACVCFSMTSSGGHSGLVWLSIKLSPERLAQLEPRMKRDEAAYMVFVGLQGRGIHFVMQTNVIDIAQHESGIEAGRKYLEEKYDLTESEMIWIKREPSARCVLGVDQNVYTDFYPTIIPIDAEETEPTASEYQNVTGDSPHLQQASSVLNNLREEHKKAEQARDDNTHEKESEPEDNAYESDQQDDSVDKPENIGLLQMRTGNGWITEAKSKPVPKMLCDELWLEGEICILFAEANQGKTILAVQIADSISRGKAMKGLRMEAKAQTVLYFDFELSMKQFEARYSEDFKDHHRWHNNFRRIEINPDADIPDGISFEDYLNDSMEEAIKKTDAKVLIIDNITYLRNDTESAKDAGPLMKYLKALKQRYGLSLLILAHCPKRDASRPLTRNDLQGSARLNQFADSMIALGASAKDSQLKYLKQVKVRSTAYRYDSDNVIVCQIIKEKSFLMLQQLRFSTEQEHLRELSEKDIANLPEQVQALKGQSRTQIQIAEELGISQSKVSRILAKLSANK